MREHDSQGAQVSVDEIYRQQYAHFSRMNDLFYKLPIGFSTIIGGLWYFGASMVGKDQFMSVVAFIFSAICCLSFCLMMERFGAAFNAYINNWNNLDGELKITIQKARWRSSKKSRHVSPDLCARIICDCGSLRGVSVRREFMLRVIRQAEAVN